MSDQATINGVELSRGRVEHALGRMYQRLGSRVALVGIAVGYAFGLITLGEVSAGGARFLDLSVSQVLTLWPLALIVVVLTAAGLMTGLPQIRTVLAWRGDGRTQERATDTWYALVGWRRTVTRAVLAALIALPPAGVYVVHHFHKTWYLTIVGVVAIAGVLASLWALTVFTQVLILRPMVEEVATYLPANFEPRARGLPLRTKTVGPLPVVTFFAALVVGAYANLLKNPAERALLATAVALGTVVVATLIFLIVNRSVLAPIDDLIAATERVRGGDIETPVPVVSDDELGTLAVSFNQMLADLRRHTDELRASRERIVAAADEERRRMERDLHDGAHQQLVLAQLKAGLVERLVDSDPAATKVTIAELRSDLERALTELRDLAHGLYPSVLESDGLPGALREAVEHAPIRATLDCDGAGRYRPELEAAVYFCCLEALQNAGKHAGDGARADVWLSERQGVLRFEVADDGRGFDLAQAATTAGLQNMRDRVGALGGDLTISSSPQAGTTVAGTIPVEGG